MSETIVYECPDCGDRKLMIYTQAGLPPQVWCSCDGFVPMDIDYGGHNDE